MLCQLEFDFSGVDFFDREQYLKKLEEEARVRCRTMVPMSEAVVSVQPQSLAST